MERGCWTRPTAFPSGDTTSVRTTGTSARFIHRHRDGDCPAPILCLTATAKPDVKQEIVDYFRETLEVDLDVVDGGTERANLHFAVIQTNETQKLAHLHNILESYLPAELEGGAIVYCATRRNAEKVAEFLNDKGTQADYFHAGLTPERKKQVQDDFIEGRLKAIAATNAFGMGIDKPDVRLVIHADIPGSLENYLQEAGRARQGQRRRPLRAALHQRGHREAVRHDRPVPPDPA